MNIDPIYIIQPVAALLIFVTLSYLVFFGPPGRLFSLRRIQRNYRGNKRKMLLHDFGFTALNLVVVITLTTVLFQWLFQMSLITVIDAPSITVTLAQFILYFLPLISTTTYGIACYTHRFSIDTYIPIITLRRDLRR